MATTYTHRRGYQSHTSPNGAQSLRSQRQQAAAVSVKCSRCSKWDDARLVATGNDLGCVRAANMKGAA